MTDTELREIEQRYAALGSVNLGGVAKQAIVDVRDLIAEIRRLRQPVAEPKSPLGAFGLEAADDGQTALALLERIAVALETGLKNGESDANNQ